VERVEQLLEFETGGGGAERAGEAEESGVHQLDVQLL
jgi:hypothetical protein